MFLLFFAKFAFRVTEKKLIKLTQEMLPSFKSEFSLGTVVKAFLSLIVNNSEIENLSNHVTQHDYCKDNQYFPKNRKWKYQGNNT